MWTLAVLQYETKKEKSILLYNSLAIKNPWEGGFFKDTLSTIVQAKENNVELENCTIPKKNFCNIKLL